MRREQLVQSLQGWHGAGALGSPGSRPWSHTGGPAPWDGSVAAGLEGSTHPCQGLRSGSVKPTLRGLLSGGQVLVLPLCSESRRGPRSRTELQGACLKTLPDRTAPGVCPGASSC